MQPSPNDAAIQRVLWRVLLLNLLVAFIKLGIGFATGAISMVADGFHSLVDGLSNVVAIIAQWIAARPPDDEHPYGHRRFEAVATFIIGGLLMLAAWEVLQAAGRRLLAGGEPDVLPASFAALIGTLLVNLLVVWYERRRADDLNSRVLAADASHTMTDVLVTCSVIVGLGLVELGIGWADPAMALFIVVVIVRVGWRIIGESVNVLVDAAPLPANLIEEAALSIPQVDEVSHVRSRGAGGEIYVDMEAQVAPEITADHAQHIRQAIQSAVQEQFPQVTEVQVNFAPHMDKEPDYALRTRAAADGLGLGVHEVIAIPSDRGYTLEMHVEVTEGLSLQSAHEQVTALEAKLTAMDDIHQVVTHIEPASGHGAPLSHSHTALKLRDDAMAMARELYPDADWHDGLIRLALGGYALTMHCHLPGNISVEEAHNIAEQVETRIRADLPQIQRVTIHTEPRGDDLTPKPPSNS
jgi:cation diffusion facilitator family transporter